MVTFITLSATLQNLINLAYEFEVQAIETECEDSNPYLLAIKEFPNSQEIIEGINQALEMKYGRY